MIRSNNVGYATMPLASGPGMHGSELDAAWHDIKPYLPPTLRAEYATQTDVDQKFERRNSGSTTAGDGGDGDSHTVMLTSALYELAMLVTGKWGALALPGPSERGSWPSGKAFEPQKKKRVFSDTDHKPSYMGFWRRMEALDGLLGKRIQSANKSYDQIGAKGKRSWVISMEKMKQAVEFIRSQENLSPVDRSVFAVNDGGTKRPARPRERDDDRFEKTPLGVRFGVLKADGNSKLPFIAYSELPMATCPGAGACGVQMKDAQTGAVVGWCYSFKAWRYPDAFARQFLNSLANYSDREFCILRNNGDVADDGPGLYWPRVDAALKEGFRPWMQYIAALSLREAAAIVYDDVVKQGRMKNESNGGRVVFLRLFVDGDIGQPDSIHSWMEAIRRMADKSARAEAASVTGSKKEKMDPSWLAPMQVYGYSKCWGEFVALDRKYGGYRWPENYTLNLSSGSLYTKNQDIAPAINALPISRGGFNAIDFRQHLQSLKGIKPENIVMPNTPPLPGVTEAQLRGIVAIEGIKYGRLSERDPLTGEQIISLDKSSMIAATQGVLKTYFDVDPSDYVVRKGLTLKKPEKLPSGSDARRDAIRARNAMIDAFAGQSELELRKKVLIIALNKMMADPNLSSVIKREIARDHGYRDVASFKADLDKQWQSAQEKHKQRLQDYDQAQARGAKVDKPASPVRPSIPYELQPDKRGRGTLTERQEKKLIAMLVHAIFVASKTSASGSCPLVCGNCADITVPEAAAVWKNDRSFKDFQAKTGAVHRCASRVPTAGYVPPPGKRLPAGVEVDRKTGQTKPYSRRADGKVTLVTGYYGSEIHIGLH